MIKKYRKNPVEVEAILLTENNIEFVYDWLKSNHCRVGKPNSVKELLIETPEGAMRAKAGQHYIVKGVKGEFYPVEKDIFECTYDEVEEPE